MLTKRLILQQKGTAFEAQNSVTINPGDEVTVDVHFEDGSLGHAIFAIGKNLQFQMTATGNDAQTLIKMQREAFKCGARFNPTEHEGMK